MQTKFYNLLKTIIKQQLLEIKQEEFSSVMVCSLASSHSLRTCKLGDKKFFLKYGGWEDEDIETQGEYNLQVGVEYLAYQIYKLFGVNIPEEIHIVSNPNTNRIGIATSAVEGKPPSYSPSPKIRAQLTHGMYVDMLLANWDIGNVANLIQRGSDVIRIDPGGTLVFRAQGERKRGFGPQVGELETMHPAKGSTPSAKLYDIKELQAAVNRFNTVGSVQELNSTIDSAKNEVANGMQEAEVDEELINEWNSLVDGQIKPILAKRFQAIKDSVDFISGKEK